MFGLAGLLSKPLAGTGGYDNARKSSNEIGVPVLTPELAVGNDRKPDVLLHPYNVPDSSVFDFAKRGGVDLARFEIRARRMHCRRTEQTADGIGAKVCSMSHHD